jgi:uncharacterized membrane protein YeaQ/YmgE (transglycosylase-associated protein family)
MGLLGWIIVGLIAGSLARAATGFERRGCLFTLGVGVLGAVLGGAIFSAAGADGVDDLSLWSLLVAFVGAFGLLLALQVLQRPRRRR